MRFEMAKARLCAVEGCDNPHKGRGFCSKHLSALKRTGSATGARRYAGRGRAGEYLLAHMHDDCPKWPFARGRGGYGRVQHEGRVIDVHRLVCELTHGPAPSPRHVAAHLCGKGADGCFGAGCIVWKTKSENQADRLLHGTANVGEAAYQSKLTDQQIAEIRAMAGSLAHREIAERFGISRSYVTQLASGKKRTHRQLD